MKLLILIFGLNAWAQETPVKDSCEKPGRIKSVCQTMKLMRSQIALIDAQRDLNRVHYSLLSSVGDGMGQMIQQLLVGPHHSHVKGIENLKAVASQMSQEAKREHPSALRTANLLKDHCKKCHVPQAPGKDLDFESIFARSWDKITSYCNQPGKNPYVCKNMHAMSSQLSYLHSAFRAGHLDYELAGLSAQELHRIASRLWELGSEIHEGGQKPLEEIITKSRVLMDYADKNDPRLFFYSREVTQSCTQCHKVP